MGQGNLPHILNKQKTKKIIMKKQTTVQTETTKPIVQSLALNASNIMRAGKATKDSKITIGKNVHKIPAGTTKNFKQKDFLAITGMSAGDYQKQQKKEGFNWNDFTWGAYHLHMTPYEYISMLHHQGLGWDAISAHLRGIRIKKSPEAVMMYYRYHSGIIPKITNDLPRGTHAYELVHPTEPRKGFNYLYPTGKPGIYMEVGAHKRLDIVARRTWRPNGLIYALYGPTLTGDNRLINGNASWIRNNFDLNYGKLSDKKICANRNLNIDCLKTFTPGPIKN